MSVILTLSLLAIPASIAQDTSISGTISLANSVKERLPTEMLLVITASKTSDVKGAPIAVKRVPAPSFPYKYTLGDEDITLVGSRFEGQLFVAARIEAVEPAGPAPGRVLEGVTPRNPVSVGSKGVDIVITDKLQPSHQTIAAGITRVGLLWSGSTPFGTSSVPEELRLAFRELGYVDNQNLAFEARYAEGRYDRLPELAASLVQSKVDVILAAGDSAAVQAARDATREIPIVMMALADTIDLGFVASLAHPSGNLTGFSFPVAAMAGKQLELLKKAIPSLRRTAILWNPSNPGHAAVIGKIYTAAAKLGLELRVLQVRGPEDFETAMSALEQSRADGALVLWDPMLYAHAGRLTLLALRHRVPTISTYREFADSAGLMAYGPRLSDIFRGAASYVDKIVRGSRPADLPVEQPIRFELVLNLTTAKALRVTLGEWVLARADRIVQ